VGVAILERAVALDPTVDHYTGAMVLASYHARSNMAELDVAKKLLDDAMAKTQGGALLIPYTYAIRYACAKGDAALYQSMLSKVVDAKDPDPDVRLQNAVAKRAARRWLGKHRAKDQCGIDLGGTASSTSEASPAPVSPAAPSTPEPAAPAETKPAKPAKPEHPHKPTAMAPKPAEPSGH
jgi:hypothetical protein